MRGTPHVRRALAAIAATGRVVLRQPTLLVYPVVLIALVAGLIAGIGAGIYHTDTNPVVWIVLYASYFVLAGLLTTFVFGVLCDESDAVLRRGAGLPFVGLAAVWRNRQRLLLVGLVAGTVGLVSWVARTTLEEVFGSDARVLLDGIAGTGLLTAIQVAVLGTGPACGPRHYRGDYGRNLDRIADHTAGRPWYCDTLSVGFRGVRCRFSEHALPDRTGRLLDAVSGIFVRTGTDTPAMYHDTRGVTGRAVSIRDRERRADCGVAVGSRLRRARRIRWLALTAVPRVPPRNRTR